MTTSHSQQKVAILSGTTASGKSALAIQWAFHFPQNTIEIINADSMLVYREMDIGTAKPTQSELSLIPHHLVNIRSPDEPFTAGDFYRAVQETLSDIEARGKRALIVGGTGFYLKALLYGLWDAPPADAELRQKLDLLTNQELFQKLQAQDPLTAQRISTQDRYRLIRALEMMTLTGKKVSELESTARKQPDPRFDLLVIDRKNDELFERISQRTREMLNYGLIDEVQRIQTHYPEARSLGAVGYAQTCDYLAQRVPSGRKIKPGLPGLQDEIELATRQLVKRQRTWFRGQPAASHFILDSDLEKLTFRLQMIYK